GRRRRARRGGSGRDPDGVAARAAGPLDRDRGPPLQPSPLGRVHDDLVPAADARLTPAAPPSDATGPDVGGSRDDGRVGATDVLDRFTPATQDWFRGAFTAPTPAQAGAWEAISAGRNALVVAPTGSGK